MSVSLLQQADRPTAFICSEWVEATEIEVELLGQKIAAPEAPILPRAIIPGFLPGTTTDPSPR